MMLHATMIPYAGIGGGRGLRLIDERGQVQFVVSIEAVPVTRVIKMEQTQAIAGALIKGIPDPIEVPE